MNGNVAGYIGECRISKHVFPFARNGAVNTLKVNSVACAGDRTPGRV